MQIRSEFDPKLSIKPDGHMRQLKFCEIKQILRNVFNMCIANNGNLIEDVI